MSLPKGMEWDENGEIMGRRTHYKMKPHAHWLELEDQEFGGFACIPTAQLRYRAELIVRAIEAPETLQVLAEQDVSS